MLKIGLIGAGLQGEDHLKNWKLVKDIEIVGFYEPDDDKANHIVEKYQLPRFLHADMLMESCDAIDITAPVGFRFQYCEKAVTKGKHVFIASPMTKTLPEAAQLVKLVEESGIKFQVQCTERYDPSLSALKDLWLHPSFIEINHLIALDDKSIKKDLLYDYLIQNIGILPEIVKSDVKSISANAVAVIADAPDIINVRLEFHNGCVASITCNRMPDKEERNMRLFQKDSCITADLLNKKTEIIKIKEPGDSNVFAFDLETYSGRKTITTDNLYIPEINAARAELEEFKKAVINNTRPVVSEIDGSMMMEVARHILAKISSNAMAL